MDIPPPFAPLAVGSVDGRGLDHPLWRKYRRQTAPVVVAVPVHTHRRGSHPMVRALPSVELRGAYTGSNKSQSSHPDIPTFDDGRHRKHEREPLLRIGRGVGHLQLLPRSRMDGRSKAPGNNLHTGSVQSSRHAPGRHYGGVPARTFLTPRRGRVPARVLPLGNPVSER